LESAHAALDKLPADESVVLSKLLANVAASLEEALTETANPSGQAASRKRAESRKRGRCVPFFPL
jgi:hypothetical protein